MLLSYVPRLEYLIICVITNLSWTLNKVLVSILHRCLWVHRGQRSILFTYNQNPLPSYPRLGRGKTHLKNSKWQLIFFWWDWKPAGCLVKEAGTRLSPLQLLCFICTWNDAASRVSVTTFYFNFLLLHTPCLLLSTTVHLYDILYVVISCCCGFKVCFNSKASLQTKFPLWTIKAEWLNELHREVWVK